MSYAPSRIDTSVIGRWWWTVDRWLLIAVGLLLVYGIVLTLAASPSAAARVNIESFHFVRQQLLFIPIAIGLMLLTSLLTPPWVRRSALVVLAGALIFFRFSSYLPERKSGARGAGSRSPVSLSSRRNSSSRASPSCAPGFARHPGRKNASRDAFSPPSYASRHSACWPCSLTLAWPLSFFRSGFA